MLFFIMVVGRKGGHKGRMRTYTSPEEIDAQMKEEKERKKVQSVHSQYVQISAIPAQECAECAV